jgi:membrane protein
MLLGPQTILIVTRNALKAFGRHRTGRMAAALAYYSIFSLFPLLLLLLAVIGYLLNEGWYVALDARDYLVQLTSEVLPAAGDWVSGAIGSVQAARGASGVIGILGLLWSASGVLNHLHIALDQIWGFDEIPDFRLTIKRRVISISVVLGLALLLFAVQMLKSITYVLANLTDLVPGKALVSGAVTWLLPFVVATVVFAVMYRTFPSMSVSWAEVWPGALLAGVGWETLKLLFALYAIEFANWQAVYGPVASVIGLLTWLYLSFTVILFGAEFSAAYSAQLRMRAARGRAQAETGRADGASPRSDEAAPGEPADASSGRSKAARAAAGLIGAVAAAGLGAGLLLGRRKEE